MRKTFSSKDDVLEDDEEFPNTTSKKEELQREKTTQKKHNKSYARNDNCIWSLMKYILIFLCFSPLSYLIIRDKTIKSSETKIISEKSGI